MKRLPMLLAVGAALGVAAQTVEAQYTYVGNWYVGQPGAPGYWTDPPPIVYSAQEAAALLFGGSPADYVISTQGTNPANINFMAYVDGWGDHDYQPLVDQGFSYSPRPDNRYWFGPDDVTYDPAYSAYVVDAVRPDLLNYAFSVDAIVTPEPATMTLLATGLAGLAAARRRRKRAELLT